MELHALQRYLQMHSCFAEVAEHIAHEARRITASLGSTYSERFAPTHFQPSARASPKLLTHRRDVCSAPHAFCTASLPRTGGAVSESCPDDRPYAKQSARACATSRQRQPLVQPARELGVPETWQKRRFKSQPDTSPHLALYARMQSVRMSVSQCLRHTEHPVPGLLASFQTRPPCCAS
jgi:hypothetical protein